MKLKKDILKNDAGDTCITKWSLVTRFGSVSLSYSKWPDRGRFPGVETPHTHPWKMFNLVLWGGFGEVIWRNIMNSNSKRVRWRSIGSFFYYPESEHHQVIAPAFTKNCIVVSFTGKKTAKASKAADSSYFSTPRQRVRVIK